jgi:hypothetical protein
MVARSTLLKNNKPPAKSHFLTMSDTEKLGTPLDPRLKMPDGLDWDLLRHNYLQNAEPAEKRWQLASLESSTGRYAKDGKMKLESEISEERAVSRIPEKTQERIIDFYKVGNKVQWIVTETNVGPATVRKILRDAGVYEPDRDKSHKRSA